jgi:hypothetical protein
MKRNSMMQSKVQLREMTVRDDPTNTGRTHY